MPNDITLGDSHPVTEDLKPLKVGGKTTSIETAEHGKGAKVNGSLEVTEGIKTSNIGLSETLNLPEAKFDEVKTKSLSNYANEDLLIETTTTGESIYIQPKGHLFVKQSDIVTVRVDPGIPSIRLMDITDTDDYFQILIEGGSNGATTIATNDDGGTAAHLTLDIDGDIILNADGGNITLADGSGTYTPSASSDATTKTYVDTKFFFSQTMNYYSRLTDHDLEWILINNDSFFKLGGDDDTVNDTETATISAANQDIARSLWFVVPYDMQITHISGSLQDDDLDAHPSGEYRLGIWTGASLGTSGNTPTAQTGSKTFTLKYVTPTVSGTEDSDSIYSFYDSSFPFTLSAGDGVWVGYFNKRSNLADASTVSMSVWGYAT